MKRAALGVSALLGAEAGADAQPTRISLAGKLLTNHYGSADVGLFTPLTGPAVSVFIATSPPLPLTRKVT